MAKNGGQPSTHETRVGGKSSKHVKSTVSQTNKQIETETMC